MLKVAIVGAGRIVRNAHLPAWRAQPDVEVALLVDVRRDVAEALAREAGIARVATDYRVALEDSTIDIVDICLPHNLHAPTAIAALEAGKHVLLEKPVALDLPAAREVIAASRVASGLLMVAENWRYAPVTVAASRLIRSGAIGDPFMLKAAMEFYFDPGTEGLWRFQRVVSGGGVFLDSGIHTVSVARMLMGEVHEVAAIRGRQVWEELAPSEDTLGLLARFADSSIGVMDFSWRAHHDRHYFAFEVFGTEAHVAFDIATGILAVTRGGRREEQALPRSTGFHEEIRHFVDCIREGRLPDTTAEEEAATLAAVLAGYKSLETGSFVAIEKP